MAPLFVVLFALWAQAAASCELNGPLDLGHSLRRRSVDLTPFALGTVREGLYYGYRYYTNSFCSGEHTGTHLDAPFHFNESGWTVEQIPSNRLIANGVFLNVSQEVAGNASFRLQPSHIDRWIEEHGPFPPNAVLLISYGWAQFHANRSAYLGSTLDDLDAFNFPGMSVETANRLIEIEGLVGIGIDTSSLDPSRTVDAHVILAARNIYNLEQVNLDQPCLPAKGFTVLAMPIKIAGGTGAPTRIVAIPNCPA